MSDELIDIADGASQADWQVSKLRIETRQWLADKETKPPKGTRVGPALNHQYWFDASKSMVQNASLKRLEAAKTVQTMIGWLWGVYTAGAIIGVALADKALPIEVTLLVAAPVPILLIAYWLAVWAQVPAAASFDSRIPASIRDAYYGAAAESAFRLKTALGAALFAAVVVAIGLVAASLSKSDEGGPQLGSFVLHHEKSNSQLFVIVDGQFGKSQKITIMVTENPGEATESIRTIVYTASKSGAVNYRLPVSEDTSLVSVSSRWQNKDSSIQMLHRTIELNTH